MPPNGRLPRDECPACGREVPIRVHGELREHNDEDGQICPASGYSVRRVLELAAAGDRRLREILHGT